MSLAPHQQRVIEEKAQLDTRLAALNTFRAGPTFHDLPGAEQVRLNLQARFMRQYADILGERIEAFCEVTQ